MVEQPHQGPCEISEPRYQKEIPITASTPPQHHFVSASHRRVQTSAYTQLSQLDTPQTREYPKLFNKYPK